MDDFAQARVLRRVLRVEPAVAACTSAVVGGGTRGGHGVMKATCHSWNLITQAEPVLGALASRNRNTDHTNHSRFSRLSRASQATHPGCAGP